MPQGLKFILSSFLIGAMSLGVAWAGAILTPADTRSATSPSSGAGWMAQVESDGPSNSEAAGVQESLQENQVYAGAFKVNIAPDPETYKGAWERNRATCETFTAPQRTQPGNATDFRVRWAENSNCLFAGGYDLGPANAITAFDEQYGLWARATAVSDGTDTVVLMLLDGAYYFAKYGQMCNDDEAHPSKFDGTGPGANQYTQDCGFRDLQASMAAKYGYTGPSARGEHGIEPSSFFLASSHAHASPDFVGAWGGVPRWYMQQVEDAIREAVYGAIDSMQPTYLEAGEILFRGGNQSRRRHYHAAEESTQAWMRFVAEQDAEPICTTPVEEPPAEEPAAEETTEPEPQPAASESPDGKHKDKDKKKDPTPSPSPSDSPTTEPTESPDPEPSCWQPDPERNTVATIGTYAAHPVDRANGTAFADLSGVFAKRAEDRFGGTGLFFQTGFGNITSRGSRSALAHKLVELIPDVGQGQQVTGNLDVKTVMRTFDQPATNVALSAGGASGVFDRPFEPRPSAVSVAKGSLSPDARSPHKRCNSASTLTVNSSVSVAKIGSLLITGGPGELFSNYTNTIKEQYNSGIAFPLSLVNDGLGYIMQSMETDHVGRQAVGFVNGPLSEYEDAYSIDACFGDHALEQTLVGMDAL